MYQLVDFLLVRFFPENDVDECESMFVSTFVMSFNFRCKDGENECMLQKHDCDKLCGLQTFFI